ncbi:DUF3857 domain-containing protein [Winogradskyella litoriviva]|uniref:DUF3857 domain-containing protein n=1 Tax=Winogradskyella litoriviva TaxID=1220182 RepID=A0ABX2E5R8_9FLAO|nr:DUF3857 domain-containing protein [Winogradskyella litoriviva]NRD23453.1 DUF3857 domain-containing protein [Winogradskyella litoriviva]
MKTLSLLFLVLTSFFCYSQNLDEYNATYPEDDVITLSLNKHISITKSKSSLSIKEIVNRKDFYLTNKRLTHATESVNYNTFNTIKNITAFTENNISDKITKSFVRDFNDEDVLVRGVFYNDQKKKSFSFPNVNKGSITHLSYEKTINDPHFLPSFLISDNVPIEKAEVSISFPNDVDVAFTTFNLENIDTNFEEIKDSDITTYKWTLKSIPKINRNYDFSPIYYIPQIIVHIKSYTINGESFPVLSNTSDLYSWYRSLIRNINNTDQSELKNKSLELIKGIESEEEKIKKIYYFVQNEINYIAFEDGLNGFIPRDAKNIYVNKYGDCKDMANLLNQMLHYAGINSYLTWIGTRKKPYSYTDVPTPITDNHMITAVKINDNYTFLDATAKYLGYGFPSPSIQGKEALIGLSETEFKIIKVPEVPASQNTSTIFSELELSNTTLIGNHKVELTGFEKLHMHHKLERKDNDDISFLESALKFGKKRTHIKDIKYKNLELADDTLLIEFSSETERYIKKIENNIYLKPHLDFNLLSEIVKNEEKDFDKKINHKYKKSFITKLNISGDYADITIPENSNFNHPYFNFKIQYKLSQDSKILEIEKHITINTLKIEVIDIEDWNHFIKALNKANKQSIVLTHL